MKEKIIDLEQNNDGTYEESKTKNSPSSTIHKRSHTLSDANFYIPIGGICNSVIRANVQISRKAFLPIAFGLAAVGFIAGLSKTIQRGKRSRLR